MSAGVVRAVHVIPSGLVITSFNDPGNETAANNPNSGAQHTPVHGLSTADVLVFHVDTTLAPAEFVFGNVAFFLSNA